ncbi:MAG: PRC-barrel domain containing protein [Candidatus Abyssobacteria bacterium SURF_17]|uniref:PRC-barrel domain containing protein n=1 Tax=Candidatus Abyssobacteria bacterium SURF_17 TaxID=2093361 RepID=A0A419ERU8_9BACT|nr:MAG: PRC-barrel domain containing protein [Candidatus Abyssubacteria bacterium SURF_17]
MQQLHIMEGRIMKALTILVAVAFALSTFLASQVFAGGEKHEGKMSATTEKSEKGIFKASKLLDKSVKNEKGEVFGSVEEFLFAQDGKIKYIILSRGGVLGVGDRLVPVPWKTVKTGIGEDAIILSLDKSFFDEAPSFARNEWDKLSDPEWNKTVHSYYEGERKTKDVMHEEHKGTMMEEEREGEMKGAY